MSAIHWLNMKAKQNLDEEAIPDIKPVDEDIAHHFVPRSEWAYEMDETPQPAEGDGAVYQWHEFAGRWEDFTKEQFDEVQSSGEIVLGETIITPAMTRKLYTRPAATAVVPKGWRVLNFTGSFKTRGERWEVYDPDGNGGAICDGDIIDPVLRDLLDALAAAPAAPKGGRDESKELLDAKVIDSLIVANEEWQAVAAKLAACLSDAIAGECPIPLFHASSAALQGYAALATGEQP